jgi:hypothetical protein
MHPGAELNFQIYLGFILLHYTHNIMEMEKKKFSAYVQTGTVYLYILSLSFNENE